MTESTAPTTAKAETPCTCLTTPAYVLDAEDGYEVPETVYGPCGRTTTREFAPGHDAKLKSLLQALYVAGSEYHRLEGGLLVSGDPFSVAVSRDWDRFLHSARDIATRKARKSEEAKQAREAKRAATLAKRQAVKDAREQAKLDKALAAKDAQHGAPEEQNEARNVQVGDQVRVTARGKLVDGEVVKVDDTVARVRYISSKGTELVVVKPLRDLA